MIFGQLYEYNNNNSNNIGAMAIPFIRIKNVGDPSIAIDWGIVVYSSSGIEIPGRLTHFSQVPELAVKNLTIKSEDVIYNRTDKTPIQNGAAEGGYLIYVIDNADVAHTFTIGTKIEVYCRDVNGNIYTTSRQITNPEKNIMYVPGSGMGVK